MRSSTARAAGLAMIVVGLVVLGVVGSYLGFRSHGRSGLDDLNFNAAEIERLAVADVDRPDRDPERDPDPAPAPDPGPEQQPTAVPAHGESTVAATVESVQDVTAGGPSEEVAASSSPQADEGPDGVSYSAARRPAGQDAQDAQEDQDARSEADHAASAALLADAYALLYRDISMHPKYWHEPLRAGSYASAVGLLPGFEPASAHDIERFAGPTAPAKRLSIPSIGVDSDVRELAVIDLGDSRSYETPKNTVGHIPQTADPGEAGNGWFFGHLESPIRGEGSVFRRLPEIADLLRHYADVGEGGVFVVVESDTGEYLYEVVATRVVHADELRLYETEGVYITLVTCVPRLDYTHRLIVTAKLVGVGL